MTNQTSNTNQTPAALLAEAESLVGFVYTVQTQAAAIAQAYDAMPAVAIRTAWGSAVRHLADMLREDEALGMQETILARAASLLSDAAEAMTQPLGGHAKQDEQWWESFEETASRFCLVASVDSLEEYVEASEMLAEDEYDEYDEYDGYEEAELDQDEQRELDREDGLLDASEEDTARYNAAIQAIRNREAAITPALGDTLRRDGHIYHIEAFVGQKSVKIEWCVENVTWCNRTIRISTWERWVREA